MKNEYKVRDEVWIHLGEPSLVPGRIVKIFDLMELNEDHGNQKQYVIEIKTGIEDIYEVRNFNMISPTPEGPINLFRNVNTIGPARFLKKTGIKLPPSALQINNEPEENTVDTTQEKPEKKKRYYRKKK